MTTIRKLGYFVLVTLPFSCLMAATDSDKTVIRLNPYSKISVNKNLTIICEQTATETPTKPHDDNCYVRYQNCTEDSECCSGICNKVDPDPVSWTCE